MKHAAIVVVVILLAGVACAPRSGTQHAVMPPCSDAPSSIHFWGSDDAAHFKYHEDEPHIIHWYEWWYANIRGEEHDIIVMFFTLGDLNRPLARVVGVFAALLDEGECIESFTCRPCIDFTLDYERCNVTIAGNRFYEENGIFFITYEKGDFSLTMRIEPGGVPFTSVRTLEGWQWGGWHVGAPYGTGNATVRYNGDTFEVRGHAYHDHNWGISRARQLNWDWSEFFIGNASIVYGAAGNRALKGGIHYVDDTTHIFLPEDASYIEYVEWERINGFTKPAKMHMYGENEHLRVDLYIELEKVYILGFGTMGKPYLQGRAYGEVSIDGVTKSVNATGFYEHHGRFGGF